MSLEKREKGIAAMEFTPSIGVLRGIGWLGKDPES
jgi:hypothetical protein